MIEEARGLQGIVSGATPRLGERARCSAGPRGSLCSMIAPYMRLLDDLRGERRVRSAGERNNWFMTDDQVVTVTSAYLEYWRAHTQEYRWPKRRRQRRQAGALPLWELLEALPIKS